MAETVELADARTDAVLMASSLPATKAVLAESGQRWKWGPGQEQVGKGTIAKFTNKHGRPRSDQDLECIRPGGVMSMEFESLSRPQTNSALAGALADTLDSIMVAEGFARRTGTIVFRRNVTGGTHSVRFHYELHPRIQPAGIFFIPEIAIVFPQIDELVERHIGNKVVGGLVQWKFTEGFQMPLMGSDIALWLPTNHEELTILLSGIVHTVLISSVLPLLSRIRTIHELAFIADEDAELLLGYGRGRWYNVAAARMIVGDLHGAAAILTDHYASDPRYRPLISSLEGISSEVSRDQT